VAAPASVARIPPGLAYHTLTAALYCLGPLALLWLVHRLSGSLFAGLAYSLISPCDFLIPEVHRDALSFFDVRRFQALLEYGEGPHIASMKLILVALAALDTAVRKSDVCCWLLCSVALAAAVAERLSRFLPPRLRVIVGSALALCRRSPARLPDRRAGGIS
jgi:hypothetical protein